MAEKAFKLEIISPRKVVFSGDVMSFSAPGVVGAFQVLYNHAPMISALNVGEVKLRNLQGAEKKYATSGGFVEVLKNQVTLLAETVESQEDIDRARAESARDRASKRLADRQPDIDLERARAALARALNRLRIVEKR